MLLRNRFLAADSTAYCSKGAKPMHHASATRFTWTLSILLIVFCLAIAPAQAQNLFVANRFGNTIRVFSASGVDLGDFATTGLNGPTALAFDKKGNLYVSNIEGNTVRRFSPTGEDLGDFATTGLSAPRGMAFDKEGNLYVANSLEFGPGWIRKFSPAGEDLGNFATTPLNSTPRGIAFDKKGNLYAANIGDNTIRKFSPTGEDLGFFATTGVVGPALIAFDRGGNLYVTNMPINAIREFSRDGVDLGDFATTGLSARWPGLRQEEEPLRFQPRRQHGSSVLTERTGPGQLRNYWDERPAWSGLQPRIRGRE
jgi:hypothetical protein